MILSDFFWLARRPAVRSPCTGARAMNGHRCGLSVHPANGRTPSSIPGASSATIRSSSKRSGLDTSKAAVGGASTTTPHARLEHPFLVRLQMKRENVRRVDEEVRAEILALGIAREFGEIFLELGFAGAPSEIGVGLGEAELGQRLHHLGTGERLRQEDHVGIARLHFADDPFPEWKRLGVRIVDAEDADAVLGPVQENVAQ